MNWEMVGALAVVVTAVLGGGWWLSSVAANSALQKFQILVLTDTPTTRSPIRGIIESALLQFKAELIRELDHTFVRERECERTSGEIIDRLTTLEGGMG